MFGYYITLRMQSGLRLLKEIGVFRSLFLMVLLGLGILVLCKVPNRWMPLLFDLLVIGGYHLMRKRRSVLAKPYPECQRVLSEGISFVEPPFPWDCRDTGRWVSCFIYAFRWMPDAFSKASQDADEACPASFLLCWQYGTNPDVPSDGMDIPYPCRCFALRVPAWEFADCKGHYVGMGYYPFGCLLP